MLVVLIAQICVAFCSFLTLLATDARTQLDELQLVLIVQSRVINWTPRGFFQLQDFSSRRWVVDSLQF